ncbi:glycosyltransferase [Clostridium pasteurianum]|uniref:UDP-glucoronosyl and UDP-glucosyl transferase n=1 Tax=Clostridium pasteurianum BC1 TaxID=86416 RepID=R4JYB0_CLOPA|nr:nucleotide disphospho-sugar-binding domain-containing protein [Clostridium pasteurianum]AGK95807.1 UDP-glucoronosyl and UDP-glucosyl transferase [Clostridium pasteurianum BC1]
MRILITPMSAMVETSGPFSRVIALCNKLLEGQHVVSMCAAEDVNYRRIEGVKNYFAPVPSPLGMPMFIGKNVLKVAQFSGIQKKKKVNSFEEVLHFVGAIDKKHFANDVNCIRKAIQDFRPDVVYSEFRIASIVAAKLENIKVITGYSYPVQTSFASNPEYSKGVKEFLKENNLPNVESCLDIFNWADLKIVPSSYELEPINDKSVVFTGPFSVPERRSLDLNRDKIIAYMGNGTISPKKEIDELTKAFEKSNYKIYIATEQVNPYKKDNITIDRRFDFNKLMPEAIAYINHGGQNSIMTGLIFGVPQIICAGNVFERQYNASSIVKLKAGVSLETEQFTSQIIKNTVKTFENETFHIENSKSAGEKLIKLGGVSKVVEILESIA